VTELRPLCGVRYDASRVDLGRVLAPPYDVIDATLRSALYARDPRNIVRVDFGEDHASDQEGVSDRHTRAASQLGAWMADGTLIRDAAPATYVTDHEFALPDGARANRLGLFGRLPALPWETAPIKPHERTLSGPKRDRLALMRASGMQTSAVFGLWRGAPAMGPWLAAVTAGPPNASACFPGEAGEERIRLWVVDDHERAVSLQQALREAELYIADGHHRYETAAAYAKERRSATPSAPQDADFTFCLMYLCAADDPGLVLYPTHRLVRPGPGVPGTLSELAAGVSGRFAMAPAASLAEAISAAATRPRDEHAMAIATTDGAALLTRPRDLAGTARQQLDVSVLEEHLVRPWGLTDADVRAGALRYERQAATVAAAVGRGEAALGIVLRGCRVEEMLAVSAAGDAMPQKSTYFYPKVPTGLLMSPL